MVWFDFLWYDIQAPRLCDGKRIKRGSMDFFYVRNYDTIGTIYRWWTVATFKTENDLGGQIEWL